MGRLNFLLRKLGLKDIVLWSAVTIICVYEGVHYFNKQPVVRTLKVGTFEKSVQADADYRDGPMEDAIDEPKIPIDDNKEKVEQKDKSKGPKCGLATPCKPNEYAFYVTSGAGKNLQPEMCFEDTFVMTSEKGNLGRGLNIFIMDPVGPKILETKTFDSYRGADDQLQRFLNEAPDHTVILAASFDDAGRKLNLASRNALGNYGSKLIHQLNFRGSFVMIGQKGLPPGCALEEVKHGIRFVHAQPVEIGGCATMSPLIITSQIGQTVDERCKNINIDSKSSVNPLADNNNCDVDQKCSSHEVPVHMYTGNANKAKPVICINGARPISPEKAAVGRGFNLVIFDPSKKVVVKTEHFDTYAEDSSMLEIFVDSMEENQMLLAVTFDDASRSFKDFAKKLFAELGSSLISSLSLRAAYFFVGQKGIKGRTPFEKIEFVQQGSNWPQPIERHFCLPLKLKGKEGKANPNEGKNKERREFCKKYDGYSDFCGESIDDVLTPAPLKDESYGDEILTIPIVIIPGMNHNNLRLMLETLLLQPGIQPDHVLVLYDTKFQEINDLTKLFSFRAEALISSKKYTEQVLKAIEVSWTFYPKAEYIIFLEEDLLIAADFLSYMSQTLPILEKDATLAAVSAWNDNGFTGVSSNASVLYRTESFPGMGFMLKKKFYSQNLKGIMQTCCSERAWKGWNSVVKQHEIITPDVSRVFHQQYEGTGKDAPFIKNLLNKDRITNLDPKAKLLDVENLQKDNYEIYIEKLLAGSKPLDTSKVDECSKGKMGFVVPDTVWQVYTIFYNQKTADDQSVLSLLCNCFGLFHSEGYPAKGLHKASIRFTFNNNHIFLIGSKSPYFKYKPSTIQEIGVVFVAKKHT